MNEIKVNPEYIRNIRGLLIPKDAGCDIIADFVETYVDNVPTLTEMLKTNCKASKLHFYAEHMKTAISLLSSVYAQWLQKEAETILRYATIGDIDVCEKKTLPFTGFLLSLSLEMQMAKIRYSQNETTNWNTIELYTDILHNLAVVSELIQQNDYPSAYDLVVNMSALDADLDARRLLEALGAGSNAEQPIEALIKSYEWQLERLYEVHHSTSKKILLVDDRPEVLETVSGYLRKDYKVFALTGGVAVLNFLAKQQPDLFIIDIQMPDMDGITLTQRIRAIPQHTKTPIMILTGNAEREMVVKAFKAGANDFLIKPANKETLLAKISSYLT